MLNADRVITKDFICSRIWSIDADSQIVRYYVKRLRDKLSYARQGSEIIRNIPGVGYKFCNHEAGMASHDPDVAYPADETSVTDERC